jgi:hypothetical protein
MPTIPACTHPIQFDEAAHLYTVAGVERPSVTQILKDAGLIDTTWYTDEARERGRAVHFATQFLDEDDLDWDTVLPQYRGYVAAWERFKAESHFIISRDSDGKLLIEYLLFQPVSGYCGMLDRVGHHRHDRISDRYKNGGSAGLARLSTGRVFAVPAQSTLP